MSEQNNGFFPNNFMPRTAHNRPATSQINAPIVPGHFDLYRSISGTTDFLNRLSFGQPIPRQFPAHRSIHRTTDQYPQNWSGIASQYRSIPGRSNQYPNQAIHPQYTAPTSLQLRQPTRTPLPTSAVRHGQHIQQPHLQPSGTRMFQQSLPPRSVPRQASPYVPAQNMVQQARFNQPAQSLPSPTPPPPRFQPPRAEQTLTQRGISETQEKDYHRQRKTPTQRPTRIPRPRTTDWTTYRINKEGKRLSKTIPPPQGTYKVSEGIGKTDYSDPRDFFAPTKEEQTHVWNALKPTREAFYELTLIELALDEMRCLSMGYNASWDEIKRKFVEWIFENFSPDRTTIDDITTTIQYINSEIPGYTTEGLRTTIKQQHNPKEIKYFADGELVVNVEEVLLKLERWYGLIEDHQYSPTWPYERERNAGGYLIQNRDCFACMHCRMNQMLCHGFREDVDRKCTPCAKKDLRCSNEDV